jgi:hypothetical protein
MNKSKEARHVINCLDATPCLFTDVFSFSKHLTIVCPTESYILSCQQKINRGGNECIKLVRFLLLQILTLFLPFSVTSSALHPD